MHVSEHTTTELNAMPMVMEPHIYFMFTAEEDSSGEAKHSTEHMHTRAHSTHMSWSAHGITCNWRGVVCKSDTAMQHWRNRYCPNSGVQRQLDEIVAT